LNDRPDAPVEALDRATPIDTYPMTFLSTATA
jgi:hypothetical protein